MSEDKETESDSPFPMHEGIPVFPFVPDRIKETRFKIIEAGDLKTDSDVTTLIQEMWLHPEVDFYYFYGHTTDRLFRVRNKLRLGCEHQWTGH